MSNFYLSLGSNINPKKNLVTAINNLNQAFEVGKISNFYLNSAAGFEGSHFINGCLEILDNYQTFDQTNAILKSIEDSLERDRYKPKFSSRPIDLDIVLVVENGEIVFASDEIKKYDFVSIPLKEIITHEKSNALGIMRVNNPTFEKIDIYL